MKGFALICLELFALACLAQSGLRDPGFVAGLTPAASSPAIPDYGGIALEAYTANSSITNLPLVVTNSIAAGNLAVVLVKYASSDATTVGVNAVSDTRGNTWSIDKDYRFGTANLKGAIISSYIATTIQSNDTITVNLTNALFGSKIASVVYCTGTASSNYVDTNTTATAYNTNVTITASTTANNTIIVGMLSTGVSVNGRTYSGGNFSTAMSIDYNTTQNWILQKQQTTSGSKSAGGVLTAVTTWYGLWVAYK